jgi:hypothetical protein
MYYDLGLMNWVFEIEQTSGYQIAERLMGLIICPSKAEKRIIQTNNNRFPIQQERD